MEKEEPIGLILMAATALYFSAHIGWEPLRPVLTALASAMGR